MRSGMTLMSVIVAAALAGIVALAVARLLGNQSKVMTVVRLREQRENLLKHYKNIVVSGWDYTRFRNSGEVYARNGDVIIPTANGNALYLGDDLYDYNHTGGTAGRWWKVTANKISLSGGSVLQADSYVDQEMLMAVEVKVEFIRKEHPVVNVKLASREEVVFLHHHTADALTDNKSDCSNSPTNPHRTQRDKDGSALYAGPGAIVQYDFNSDYAKCSQVPLVEPLDCDKGAILGFLRKSVSSRLVVSGKPICSADEPIDPLAGIRDNTVKRTVEAIDCSGSGYIEWMKDDEKPRCVTGTAPGASSMRVAAQSKNGPFTSKTYTLVRRTSAGGNGTHATYTTESCTLKRHHGISSFKPSGKSGEVAGYLRRASYDGATVVGPPGPAGEPGANNAPRGARGDPGARGRCSCCCTNR